MSSNKKIILMCKDVAVAETALGGWIIHNSNLVPKNLVTHVSENDDLFMHDTITTKWIEWCASRVLSIDRHYAKKILNVLGLSQSQSPFEKAKISVSYRCVSLCDSYWVRFGDNDTTQWKDVNLRANSLSKVVSLIALAGTSMTLSTHNIGHTAEVSTLGSYAKAWFREDNGIPSLYKTYGSEKDEVEREVSASNVIDCFNVYGNLKYEYVIFEGVRCSKCKLMTTDDIGMLHAADLDVWCMQQGTNVINWTKKHYLKEYAQMVTLDYILANTDRHMWNWGFYVSMLTGEILKPHPLYDHNNCFDYDALIDETWKSILEQGKTMKEAAQHYVKRSELKMIKIPSKKMFPSQLAYEVFKERCKQLNLWQEDLKSTLFTKVKT